MDSKSILYELRQLKFPESTIAALDYLSSSISRNVTKPKKLPGHIDDFDDKIMSEFIFMVYLKQRLRMVHDLHIINLLLNYFSSHEKTHHAIFKMLFVNAAGDDIKMSILSKLISLAVGLQNTALLESAAEWMQTQGCSSGSVLTVVADVLHDYTDIASSACSSVLQQLPKVSSYFTCNFLTALTCIHTLPGSKCGSKPVLSVSLLELICEWLTQEPRLALVSLYQICSSYAVQQPHRAALWTSPTKPNMQTPIPGLMRWCTKAPLLVSGVAECSKWACLLSQLQLVLLQTLVAFPLVPGSQQLELITLADMNQTVGDFVALVSVSTNPQTVLVATDRLVQILQVALSTGAFRCSLGDLRNICQRLPSCGLLKMVEKHHLSFTAPPMHNAS